MFGVSNGVLNDHMGSTSRTSRREERNSLDGKGIETKGSTGLVGDHSLNNKRLDALEQLAEKRTSQRSSENFNRANYLPSIRPDNPRVKLRRRPRSWLMAPPLVAQTRPFLFQIAKELSR